MTPITFQQFKDELTALYESGANSDHKDFHNPRFYEDLPHNQAQKVYGKQFKARWWFMFDFNEVYTAIITYEPGYENFSIYIEYNVKGNDKYPPLGKTMKMAVACSTTSAWTTLSLYMLQVYMGAYVLTRNDVWYVEDTANKNFLDGDCPFDVPYRDMSFTRGLSLLLDAYKHPDKEWRGQRIGLTLNGQFSQCEFVITI